MGTPSVPWAACASAWWPFPWRSFSPMSNLNLSLTAWGHFLSSCPFFPDPSLPGCPLLSRSCGETEGPPKPPFLQGEPPQLPQLLLLLQPLLQLCSFPWTHSTPSISFLLWGAQNWPQDSRFGLASDQYRGTSLVLLATQVLIQATCHLPSCTPGLMFRHCQPTGEVQEENLTERCWKPHLFFLFGLCVNKN